MLIRSGVLGAQGRRRASAGGGGPLGAWDLTSASYASKSLDFSSQITTALGIYISPGGSKLFLASTDTPEKIFQYSMSTPWDMSTATYDSKNYDVSSEDNDPKGLSFNPSGTKMYVVGDGNDNVYQYSLGTPWDVSTASYDSKSYSVATSTGDIFMRSDGTTLYTATNGAPDRIDQHTLSTPWDISTAATASKSHDVSSEVLVPEGVSFKSNGTKMFVIDSTNTTGKIYQYSLSTSWDVSTATYDSINFSAQAQATDASGLFIGNNGDTMYVLDAPSTTVYQYTL